MPDISQFEWIFRTGPSAHLVRGFGHVGGHMFRGGGIILGGKLLAIGLAAVVTLTLAAMATLSASDWMKKQAGGADYSRAAGWVVFLVVALVLGLVLARFL